MIDATNSIASSRTPSMTEAGAAQLRATPPAPQQAPTRQAENVQGVEVQISTAAREAAARDPVSAATDAVGDANAQRPGTTTSASLQQQVADGTASSNTSADPAAANAARGTEQNAPTNNTSRQAIQLFTQNNGTGNDAPSSPLRASA